MALFRYLEKKDNLSDPNISASKELAIPVAIAALYNASVFYPRSRDTYKVTYMRKGRCLDRVTANFSHEVPYFLEKMPPSNKRRPWIVASRPNVHIEWNKRPLE